MNSKANRVLALAVAALLLLAVVAVGLSTMRSDPDLPEDSPEAVVQAYLAAVYTGDTDEAATHLDPQGGCGARDLDDGYVADDSRVVLRSSTEDGDRATVQVEVVRDGGGPFGGNAWSDEETFRLRQDDAWVITGVPWPAYRCDSGEDER